ncbi:hypothetical protein [Haloterrigena salina]|uniref:hypothetical protein n=1 Tax=Haloterrigena salina TaxID=504937 RepID=UPI00126843BB|nr:hypothetical protein [Haloterrigena salina]
MIHPFEEAWKNKVLQGIIALSGMVLFTSNFTYMNTIEILSIATVLIGVILIDFVGYISDISRGTKRVIFGITLIAVMMIFILSNLGLIGGIFGVVGLWFLLDGITIHQYGTSTAVDSYVATAEREEAMLRLQLLNRVYQHLRKSPEPQSITTLASELDLTESRVQAALNYLESKNQIEKINDQYRAIPPKWGMVTPVVLFGLWIVKSIISPFRRILRNNLNSF